MPTTVKHDSTATLISEKPKKKPLQSVLLIVLKLVYRKLPTVSPNLAEPKSKIKF